MVPIFKTDEEHAAILEPRWTEIKKALEAKGHSVRD
jgi:hypothetical protein